LAALQ